jgi:hypothetical protein
MILYPSWTGGGWAYAVRPYYISYLETFLAIGSLWATKGGFSSEKPAINNGISTIPCHNNSSWQEMLRRLNTEVQHG